MDRCESKFRSRLRSLNPDAQDLRPTGGDFCGALSNAAFGQPVLTNAFDPAILHGWGVRPSDWTLTAAIDQQLMPRAVLSVSYVRRWFDGFTVADNRSLAPSDLTPFSAHCADGRSPAGRRRLPVGGLYDIVPEKAGQVSNLITGARRTTADWYQFFSGVDVTLNARFGSRFTAVGGTSTGQTVADNCGVRERLPELSRRRQEPACLAPD